MVPATAERYRARCMAPSRPRRTAFRRALSILVLVGLASASAVTMGPTTSVGGIGTAGPTPLPSGTGVAAVVSPSATTPATPVPSPSATATAAPSPTWPGAPPASGPTPTGPIPPSSPPQVPTTPVLTDTIGQVLQARLDKIRAKYAMPGVSVAILYPDGAVWSGSSGLANVAAKIPVTADTAFAAASVSKTFTSALILALARDGDLDINAPVATYLPELHLDPRITARQLLDHTSGLRDYFFHQSIDKLLLSRPARRWTESQALRYVGTPYFKPGRGWHYSNTNYLVLGLLAERVGKTTLGRQFEARFFRRLHLDHTYYQPDQSPGGPVAHGYRFVNGSVKAKPIDLSDGSDLTPFTSVVTAAAGAGGIATTSTDLVRWAHALYGGELLGNDVVLAMIADGTTTRPYRPRVPYGLGVQMIDLAGHPTLGHSGRFLGFRSLVRWLPDEGVAIAVLTNQSRTDPAPIASTLIRIALGTRVIAAAVEAPHPR
jgi:CubicO group peptidase (beta-lactamase class C family)